MLRFRPFTDDDWCGYSGAGEDAHIATAGEGDYIIARATESRNGSLRMTEKAPDREVWLATVHVYGDGPDADEWACVETDSFLAAVTLCRAAAAINSREPLVGAALVGFHIFP